MKRVSKTILLSLTIILLSITMNAQHSLQKNSNSVLPQHFPYPVIFIHGLTGGNDTWKTFKEYSHGWSYGGEFRYHLNYDNNTYNAYLPSDFKDFQEGSNAPLPAADFYTVNFRVNFNGIPVSSYDDNKSSQSAIRKQGLAISRSITYVLNATGKDKVILVGHSMGGLAAREYLQNSEFWQSDNEHHVAKLITSGTPHGGSDVTGVGAGSLFNNLDEQSEAVRDLRENYSVTGADGVYLFGGVESWNTIDNSWIWNYDNIDVNCNGEIGNNVVGLNQKTTGIFDVDISCIVGSITGVGISDGVVYSSSADIFSYYFIYRDIFEPIFVSHLGLPDETQYNFLALDEPDEYVLAYGINVNEFYNGYIQEQGGGSNYVTDYDDYLFNIPSDGYISVNFGNNQSSNMRVAIVDADDNSYIQDNNAGSLEAFSTVPLKLEAGNYYLEVYALPNNNSWIYPYNFQIDYTPCSQTASSISIVGNDILCEGESIILTAEEGYDSYVWSNGQTGRQIVVTQGGNYSVTTSINGCTATSNSIFVNEIDLPIANFTINNNGNQISINNNSQNGTSYFWEFGDGNTSSLQNPTHTYSNDGIYEVTLTVSNQCVGVSLSQTIQIMTTSVDNKQLENSLNIYPNPTKDKLTIESSFEWDNYQINDMLGRVILKGSFQKQIDVSSLNKGIYTLTILDENGLSITRKIVKE